MSVLFVEYPKCTTCRKAKKYLEENNIEFIDRHIAEENPTKDELIVVKDDIVLVGFKEAEWNEKLK